MSEQFNSSYVPFSKYSYLTEEFKNFPKKTPETRTRELIVAKYESKSNVCEKCYVLRSTISGECNC